MKNTDECAKCAMVTGGGRGIGQGIALVLAEHGYDVAITYATSAEGAKETQSQIEALGRRCFVYEARLEEPAAPECAVNQARADLGRLDVMVCNAGRDVRTSVLSITAAELDFLYANNLRNYFLSAGAAARHMVNDKTAGSIIMITSARGQSVHPDDFYYGALKAAMDRACKSMALDLSVYNIRVNCIAPGVVGRKPFKEGSFYTSAFANETIPLRRPGDTRDIGEAAAFLAGERAAYITGTTLMVDGGLSLPALLEQREPIQWVSQRWHPMHYEKAMAMLNRPL